MLKLTAFFPINNNEVRSQESGDRGKKEMGYGMYDLGCGIKKEFRSQETEGKKIMPKMS